MALYEYHCQACGKGFDKLVPYENRDLISCPDCGAKVDRKVSPFSWKQDNPFTKDGEGFTSRDVPLGELKEMSKETRSR